MLPEFANILDNKKYKAFAFDLMPLTLGHLFILDMVQSPIIIGGNPTANDYLMLSVICSRRWNEVIPFIFSDTFARYIIEKANDCGIELANAISKNKEENYVNKQIKEITEYLAHYMTAPQRWQSDNKSTVKSPWQLYLVASLQKELGITEDEAWNMPCNKAFAYFATLAEAYYNDKTIKSELEVKLAKKINEETEGEKDNG